MVSFTGRGTFARGRWSTMECLKMGAQQMARRFGSREPMSTACILGNSTSLRFTAKEGWRSLNLKITRARKNSDKLTRTIGLTGRRNVFTRENSTRGFTRDRESSSCLTSCMRGRSRMGCSMAKGSTSSWSRHWLVTQSVDKSRAKRVANSQTAPYSSKNTNTAIRSPMENKYGGPKKKMRESLSTKLEKIQITNVECW